MIDFTKFLSHSFVKDIDDKTHSNIAWRFYSKMNDSIIYVEMLESKLFRSIHNHFNRITWSWSHHVILQFCFCIVACDTLTQNMNCERFFIISTFSKLIESLKLHFLKFLLQTNNFFLTHFLYAKSTFNRDRKLYKKRWCDSCEFDCLTFIENWFIIEFSQIIVAKRVNHCREMIQLAFAD
jgi:hypothetical protein